MKARKISWAIEEYIIGFPLYIYHELCHWIYLFFGYLFSLNSFPKIKVSKWPSIKIENQISSTTSINMAVHYNMSFRSNSLHNVLCSLMPIPGTILLFYYSHPLLWFVYLSKISYLWASVSDLDNFVYYYKTRKRLRAINKIRRSHKMYYGDFIVNKSMVKDGKFIKGQIPYEVKGEFYCQFLSLTSLEGGPSIVTGDYICSNNHLLDLTGCPESIGGRFSCSFNDLKSLKGGPKRVGGHYHANDNKLETLEYCPGEVFFTIYLNNNNRLTSLENLILNSNVKIINTKKLNNQTLYAFNVYEKGDDYWEGFLKYSISEGLDINETVWPEGFLDSNIGKSAKSIRKYNL